MAVLKNFMVTILILAVIFFQVSLSSTNHPVHNYNYEGWTNSLGTDYDYDYWASHNTFHVGDTIEFLYDNEYHNVMQVTHDDFQQCNPSSPIETYTTGDDKILLNKPGHYYFICGYPGHCQMGQKINILINPSAAPSIPPASPPTPNTATISFSTPNTATISFSTPNTATISFFSSKLMMALASIFLLLV